MEPKTLPNGGEESTEETTEENPLDESAGEEAEGGEGEAAAAATEKKDAPKTEVKDAPKKEGVPWYQRRINELTAKLKLSAAENEALNAAIAAKKEGNTAAETVEEADGAEAVEGLTQAQIDKRAEELAQQKLEERQFIIDSNKIFDAGVAEFSKASFDEALTTIKETAGGLTRETIDALMELEHPQRVIMALADDPDEAARILSLKPVRMAAALAKVAPKEPKKKKGEQISNAPAPITPVGGGSKAGKSYEEMDAEEYARARDAELARKRERR